MSSKKAALFKSATSNINTARTSLLAEADRVKDTITILPELEAYIPPLSTDEFSHLERDILENGCRETLLIWSTYESVVYNNGSTNPINILVDGHNRYRICQRNKVEFNVALKEFYSLQEAKHWMIRNQLGRRNLTPENYAYLRGKLYNSLKEERGKYDRESDVEAVPTTSENDTNHSLLEQDTSELPADLLPAKPKSKKTAQVLAEQFSVTEKTIRNDGQFAAGLDKLSPSLQKEVLSRKAKVPKADIMKLANVSSQTPIETVHEIQQVVNESPQKNLQVEHVDSSATVKYVNTVDDLSTYLSDKSKLVSKAEENLLDLTAQRQVSIINEMAQRLRRSETLTKESCEEMLFIIDELKGNLNNLLITLS